MELQEFKNFLNHDHGDDVRKQWPEGTKVTFKVKDCISGKPMEGVVVGHLYVNVLIIKSGDNVWECSTRRCNYI